MSQDRGQQYQHINAMMADGQAHSGWPLGPWILSSHAWGGSWDFNTFLLCFPAKPTGFCIFNEQLWLDIVLFYSANNTAFLCCAHTCGAQRWSCCLFSVLSVQGPVSLCAGSRAQQAQCYHLQSGNTCFMSLYSSSVSSQRLPEIVNVSR